MFGFQTIARRNAIQVSMPLPPTPTPGLGPSNNYALSGMANKKEEERNVSLQTRHEPRGNRVYEHYEGE